jgi:hypothetical protein
MRIQIQQRILKHQKFRQLNYVIRKYVSKASIYFIVIHYEARKRNSTVHIEFGWKSDPILSI